MKVILVDDEALILRQLEMEIENFPEVEIAGKFNNPVEAIEFLEKNKVEAVFSDIEMPGMNGIDFGKKAKEIQPGVVIVFITGYEQYAIEAMKIKADFYLTKPFDSDDIKEVLERSELLAARQKSTDVHFRTFGRFDVFVNGESVHFPNAKAKELLALCIDHRGGKVMMEEAIDKLWEDRPYDTRVKNLYRKAVMNIKQLFQSYGMEDIFVNSRGSCNINREGITCDYFDLLDGKIEKSDVVGYYMPEYAWAEFTASQIEDKM